MDCLHRIQSYIVHSMRAPAEGRGGRLQRIKSALMRDDLHFTQVQNRETAGGPTLGVQPHRRPSRERPLRRYRPAGSPLQIGRHRDVTCRHSAISAAEVRSRAVVARRRLTFMTFAVVDQPQRLCKAGALQTRPPQNIYPHCSNRVALHSRYIAATIRVRGRA